MRAHFPAQPATNEELGKTNDSVFAPLYLSHAEEPFACNMKARHETRGRLSRV